MLHFLIITSLCAALASAQYTITYYASNQQGTYAYCSSQVKALRCRNWAAFECCEAPPAPQAFRYAQVTSTGPTGVVAFHSTDSGGGCLGCTSGGTINQCYNNIPFETISVLSVSNNVCQTYTNGTPSKFRRAMASIDKSPIIEGTGGEASVPKVCKKINAIQLDGIEYHLTIDLHEEFMHDFHNMPGHEIVAKYALKKTGATGEHGEPQTPQEKV